MLTDKELRNRKPREKPYKVAAGNGLHLLVKPGGSRLWRLKYRVNGSEKLLSFGMYPEVSLKHARDRRDEARPLMRRGFKAMWRGGSNRGRSYSKLVASAMALSDHLPGKFRACQRANDALDLLSDLLMGDFEVVRVL
jgi:hypothetical protein